MILVYTCTYLYIKFTTTLHFQSGSIRLALPTCLSCSLVHFNASSCLPLLSILNWQTTLAWLATSELPQRLGQHPAPPCSDSTEGPGSSSIAHHDVFLENLLHDQYIPVYTSTYHFWSVHLSMYMYILVCTCTYYILLFGTMLLYEILVIWMSVVHQVLYQSIPLHTDIYWHKSTCLVLSRCIAF